MARPAIANGLLSDQGTLTAANEVPSLPATNLLTRQLAEKWRTDGLTNIALELDLGAVKPLSFVGLFGTNASSTAKIQVRLADSQANLTAAPAYNSLPVSHWPEADLSSWAETSAIHWITPAVSARWIRVDIADPDNTDAYYQAGRLYAGESWQPSRNFQYPQPILYVDDSEFSTTDGGQEFAEERPLIREMTLNLRFLSEAEVMDGIAELQRKLGATRDLFVMRDPQDPTYLHRRSFYGRLKSLNSLVNSTFKVFDAQLVFRELV